VHYLLLELSPHIEKSYNGISTRRKNHEGKNLTIAKRDSPGLNYPRKNSHRKVLRAFSWHLGNLPRNAATGVE